MLVWDGSFGADVPEMRMPLPELYPLSSDPYDLNDDIGARTMEEALVSFAEGILYAIKSSVYSTKARERLPVHTFRALLRKYQTMKPQNKSDRELSYRRLS